MLQNQANKHQSRNKLREKEISKQQKLQIKSKEMKHRLMKDKEKFTTKSMVCHQKLRLKNIPRVHRTKCLR